MTYPLLRALVGGYFHEDWYDEYPDAWGAVDDFIEDRPAEARGLPAEIDGLLTHCKDDDQVAAILNNMGLGYYVMADGYTSYREWLSQVGRHIQTALSTRSTGTSHT